MASASPPVDEPGDHPHEPDEDEASRIEAAKRQRAEVEHDPAQVAEEFDRPSDQR